MDYSRVNALLVEAIKEQRKEGASEKAEKDARIADLNARLIRLEKLMDVSGPPVH